MNRPRSRVSVADFGLAAIEDAQSRVTRSGAVLGSAPYMAPEQARGEGRSLTAAVDIWALGCVLYEAVAGRRAFEGETGALVVAAGGRGPAPLGRVRPGLPPGLWPLVLACLAPIPAFRPTAQLLAADCARLLHGERPRARPPSRLGRRLGAAGGVAALAVAIGLMVPGSRPTPTPAPGAAPRTAAAERAARRAADARNLDPLQAAAWLGEALVLEPDRYAWRLERGLLLWAAGRADDACAEWAEIPTGGSDGDRARLYVGLRWMFQPTEDRTALLWSRAAPLLVPLESVAGDVGALARAALAIMRRQPDRVPGLLRGVPGWEAATLRGQAALESRGAATAQAAGHFTEALLSSPPFSWMYANVAQAYLAQGDHGAAVQAADRSLALDPTNGVARFNRAIALTELGELLAARSDFDALIAERAGDALALEYRGLVRHRTGDLAGAIEDLDAAMELPGRRAYTYFLRGNARYDSGDAQGAIDDYDLALDLEPRNVEYLLNRADTQRKLGDLDAAGRDYRVAMAVEGAGVLPHIGLAMIRLDRGDALGACAVMEASLQAHPDSSRGHFTLGVARARAGEFAAAAEAFRHCLTLAPEPPVAADARARLAQCEERLGR